MENFTNFTLSILRELEKEGRFGTAHVYQSTLNAFTLYWQERHRRDAIPISAAFTPATLKDFEQHLKQRMLKMNTISTYLRMLRAIYHRALHRNFINYIPGLFAHVYTGTRADVKRALPAADMGQLLSNTPHQEHRLEETRVWFALLFMLRGMPFADLARLRKCDLQDGVIAYRRQKTGKPLSIHLTGKAAELMDRCADLYPESPYLLNILWKDAEKKHAPIGSREEYRQYQNMLRSFNRRLKKLACKLGIHDKLSSYTARHTWATIAYYRKYSTGIISDALGHSSVKVTETYLKPFKEDVLDKANKEIINYTEKCNDKK